MVAGELVELFHEVSFHAIFHRDLFEHCPPLADLLTKEYGLGLFLSILFPKLVIRNWITFEIDVKNPQLSHSRIGVPPTSRHTEAFKQSIASDPSLRFLFPIGSFWWNERNENGAEIHHEILFRTLKEMYYLITFGMKDPFNVHSWAGKKRLWPMYIFDEINDHPYEFGPRALEELRRDAFSKKTKKNKVNRQTTKQVDKPFKDKKKKDPKGKSKKGDKGNVAKLVGNVKPGGKGNILAKVTGTKGTVDESVNEGNETILDKGPFNDPFKDEKPNNVSNEFDPGSEKKRSAPASIQTSKGKKKPKPTLFPLESINDFSYYDDATMRQLIPAALKGIKGFCINGGQASRDNIREAFFKAQRNAQDLSDVFKVMLASATSAEGSFHGRAAMTIVSNHPLTLPYLVRSLVNKTDTANDSTDTDSTLKSKNGSPKHLMKPVVQVSGKRNDCEGEGTDEDNEDVSVSSVPKEEVDENSEDEVSSDVDKDDEGEEGYDDEEDGFSNERKISGVSDMDALVDQAVKEAFILRAAKKKESSSLALQVQGNTNPRKLAALQTGNDTGKNETPSPMIAQPPSTDNDGSNVTPKSRSQSKTASSSLQQDRKHASIIESDVTAAPLPRLRSGKQLDKLSTDNKC